MQHRGLQAVEPALVHIGANAHRVHEPDRRAEMTGTAEDEGLITGRLAYDLQPAAQVAGMHVSYLVTAVLIGIALVLVVLRSAAPPQEAA